MMHANAPSLQITLDHPLSRQNSMSASPSEDLNLVVEPGRLVESGTHSAGQGDDLFYASLHDESMTGHAGRDIFAWLAEMLQGCDTITDFNAQADTLALDLAFDPSLTLTERLMRLTLSQQGEDGVLQINMASGEPVQTIILQHTNLLQDSSLSSQAALQHLIENHALLVI